MKLMVIDGNSMINRSFYGIRPLSTGTGCILMPFSAS